MTLQARLESGCTTLARCWMVRRRDGVTLGFTDHDRDLVLDGVTFRARTGVTGRALSQGTGLAVDNTEALGALSDASLSEVDIRAGRYDGAEVEIWLVDWSDTGLRRLEFRGTLGEVARTDGAFRAELRGLAEPLGRPLGRVFQKACTAVLGDAACGFDLSQPGFRVDVPAQGIEEGDVFRLSGLEHVAEGWFAKGRLEVLDGPAAGLSGTVKADRSLPDGLREIVLWQRLGVMPEPGDALRLTAGCDKRAGTCREKFGNFLNFQGFPHVPGDDWSLAVPREGERNDGGPL